MSKTGEQKAGRSIRGFDLGPNVKPPSVKKNRDASYCIHCGKIQPKNTLSPDFLVSWVYSFIEVKGPHLTWNFGTGEVISEPQHEALLADDGWLLVELGVKPRPKSMKAFLIPYRLFNHWREDTGATSIRLGKHGSIPNILDVFPNYAMVWIPDHIENEKRVEGHWSVPDEHAFWGWLESYLRGILDFVKGKSK